MDWRVEGDAQDVYWPVQKVAGAGARRSVPKKPCVISRLCTQPSFPPTYNKDDMCRSYASV